MTLLPFRAGLHAADPGKKGFLNLALGESPYGISPKAQTTLLQSVTDNLCYPDSSCEKLASKIALHYQVKPEMVFVGNGIDELILISALSFLTPLTTCLLNHSTFSGFEAAVKAAHATPEYAPLTGLKVDANALGSYLQKKPHLWFLCNPHNPTGTTVPLAQLLELAYQNGVIAVVDEAYAEYAAHFESALKWIHRYPNLLVFRTFSKIYGMAGLRCGYAIGSPALIDQLKKMKHVLPFSVNRIALEVASIAIEDQNFVQECFNKTEAVKAFFYHRLQQIGLPFVRSSTNFVLVQFEEEVDWICQEMKEKYRILIRSAAPFGLPKHIRITLGNLHQMQQVAESLEKLLDKSIKGEHLWIDSQRVLKKII